MRGTIPLEMYVFPEITGNRNRNHSKSGFTSKITISRKILLTYTAKYENISKIHMESFNAIRYVNT